MAPVGPLRFVARQVSAWISYDFLYFGDVVRHFCRVDRYRVPDVVPHPLPNSRYLTSSTI